MVMEGAADKRLRERGIHGKEPEGPEGQAPRKTGGNGGKEGNGRGTEGNEGERGNGGEQEGNGGMRERRGTGERRGRRSQNKNTKDSRLVSDT